MPSESGVTSRRLTRSTGRRSDAGGDRGADRHRLVGVDPLDRRLAEELLDLALHDRAAGLAADQQHSVDVRGA
jgi:hypothetical protein